MQEYVGDAYLNNKTFDKPMALAQVDRERLLAGDTGRENDTLRKTRCEVVRVHLVAFLEIGHSADDGT